MPFNKFAAGKQSPLRGTTSKLAIQLSHTITKIIMLSSIFAGIWINQLPSVSGIGRSFAST